LIILRTDTGFSWPHFVLTSSVSSPWYVEISVTFLSVAPFEDRYSARLLDC
jgi:hypothetical protein